MNWDYRLEPEDEIEIDEARKRQDEEDLAQSRAEDYELGWYH